MNIVAMDALAKIEERLGLFYTDSKKDNNPNLIIQSPTVSLILLLLTQLL